MKKSLVLLGAALVSWSVAAAASGADARFDKLAARFIDEYPALSPVGATQLGDHRFDHLLDEVTPEARERTARLYRRYQRELGKIPRDKLSRANQVDAALLAHDLEAGLFGLETLQEWAWNPLRYTGLAGGAVYGLLARDFAPLPERLGHVADRLVQFPRLFEQVRATLEPERVPKVHAETAVRQNRGVLSLFDEMVRPNLGVLAPDERARLEAAMETAREAVERQQTWLEEELLPSAGGDFRIGAELFDRKLAFTLHTPLTRAQVKQRAEREYRDLRAEMYEIARGVWAERYPLTEFPAEPDEAYRQALIRAVLEIAYQELPPRDAIVETAREQLEQATDFVRQAGLVSVPDDPVEIIVMPEFQRGVSVAYCDSPGALDAGQKTFYAVSPIPEAWTEQQVVSFLREYNLLSLQVLTIHEAMPGHYLQLAHSNRYPSKLRAVLSSGPFIEGWAEYAERQMVAAGYLDHDPLFKLIQRKWYLRATVNAILDSAIHVDGMTEDQAMRLMIEGAFQEEREAAGKWVRAQLTSTQLSTYFVGYQEHADLRREVEARESERFALQAYHDRLLSYGSPPVQFVRALMLDLPVPR